MPLPGNLPYYMTGAASRPGAMQNYVKNQRTIAKRKGVKPPVPGKPPKIKRKVIPKIVATSPKFSNVADYKPTDAPKPKGTAKGGKLTKPVNTKPVKAGNTSKTTKTVKTTTTTGVGFDPKKMAQTLTNLGYDADIAAIDAQIARNQGSMEEALADIQGWANQVEQERARGAAESKAAFDQALAQSQKSDAAIAALGGGTGNYENAAYANVGEDMLSTIGASGAAFDARMAPILGAQFADYDRRARAAFHLDEQDLRQEKQSALKEKRQAYQQNLLDLMDMSWQRQQDVLQYQTAQQALTQAQALQGYEVQKAQQDLKQGKQQITANDLALRKSRAELQKLQQQTNGFDWSDPSTPGAVAKAAFQGALAISEDKPGVFMINPKVALQNAQTALSAIGLQGNPRAQQAIWNAFIVSLRLSHQHGRWRQYYLNKNGQLVYDPTRKKRNR